MTPKNGRQARNNRKGSGSNVRSVRRGLQVAGDGNVEQLSTSSSAPTARRVEIPAYVDTGLRQFGTFVRDTASVASGTALGNKISQIWDK